MIGNDDCGQMSAWYILSSMGFYPVNPATGEFVLGAPQVKKATLHLTQNKKMVIEAVNISTQNIYSEKVFWNKKTLEKPFLTYRQIMNGGVLRIEMTEKQ